MEREDLVLQLEDAALPGYLRRGSSMRGLVVFAHGTGSSRDSRRNNYVADRLAAAGIGSLLFDLLTEEEDREYSRRFDLHLLTNRMSGALFWAQGEDLAGTGGYGLFGSSTGSAAALATAAALGGAAQLGENGAGGAPEPASAMPVIRAIVSRGGRPDMAREELSRVREPTLLIVGGLDTEVLALHREIMPLFSAEASLEIVEGATHLFQEPGALEKVADLAVDWFRRRL